MGRFIFDLPDDLRGKLEQHRVAWGLRSLSAAAQHLIATKADVPFSPQEVGTIMREIGERVSAPAPIGRERPKPGALLKKR
jgi:hypothetical protein